MSAKPRPVTPYERLLKAFKEYVSEVQYPRTRFMWRYPKNKLGEGYRLDDLAERVQAAEQLGYDVFLKMDSEGLAVMYRKQRPERPWETR